MTRPTATNRDQPGSPDQEWPRHFLPTAAIVLILSGFDRGPRAPSSSAYAAILGHFAARRDKQQEAATWFLEEAIARCNPQAWPYPLVKYLRGEMEEPTLYGTATVTKKLVELHCFLGLDLLQEGLKDDAMAHFLWVKQNARMDQGEYAIATFELDQLGPEAPGHGKPGTP